MREIKFRAWDAVNKKIIGPFQVGSSLSEIWPPQMQYTGLKDRTGKEIYEGDIVRYKWGYEENTIEGFEPQEEIAEVMWDDKDQPSDIYPAGKITGFRPFNEYDVDCDKFVIMASVEVIGNRFENPELLKK